METVKRRRQSELEPSGQDVFVNQKNPLLVDVILLSLFSFTNFKNLKECRLVCKKWKENCDLLLIRNSMFVVKDASVDVGRVQNIRKIFESIDENLVEFTSFRFKMLYLSTSVREMYLDPHKSIITRLEIIGQKLSDSNLSIAGHNANRLIGPNLRRLRLVSKGEPWAVSLEKICLITHIDLKNCTIAINCDRKVAPSVLLLRNCFIKSNSNFSIPVYMSEFVDFSLVQKLMLFGDLDVEFPIMKLCDCVNIKDIFLKGMTIDLAVDGKICPEKLVLCDNRYELNEQRLSRFKLNNRLSSGEMKKLVVTSSRTLGVKIVFDLENFVVSDDLSIQGNVSLKRKPIETQSKKLALETTKYPPPFDVAFLPVTVESLFLTFHIITPCVASRPVSFPFLNQLFLSGCLNSYPHFQNCPALVFIALNFTGAPQLQQLDLDLLPPNIKKLSFFEFANIPIVGKNVLKLESLDFSIRHHKLGELISFVKMKIFSKIQTKLFIIKKCEGHLTVDKYFSPGDILIIIKMKGEMLGEENVLFGPVKWKKKDTLENCGLLSLVESKSNYYFFEDQLVLGISKRKFLKQIPCLSGKKKGK